MKMKRLVLLFLLISQFSHAKIYINEFLASNNTINTDPTYDEYGDWIELYNSGSSDVILDGYFLTDDKSYPRKWQIPASTVIKAGSYLLFWADKKNISNHTNFSLSSDKEFVGLFNSRTGYEDSLSYQTQRIDISQGRSSTEINKWLFFSSPSPNSANTGTTIAALAPKPVFSLKGGFYPSTITLQISSSVAGAQIYYTTDGSFPTTSSSLVSGNITISKTSVIKAFVKASGSEQSMTETYTYFINEHHSDLPVISFSTKPDVLFNETTGLYMMGPNPGTLNGWPPYAGANFWKDVEIPITLQMYSPEGNKEFSVDAGARIFGGYSRIHPCKSFAIYFRPEYGYSSLDYKVFNDKKQDEFQSIILRNSGSDFGLTMFRDAFAQNVIKDQMDLDYQEYQPTAVYINGQYWGVMNLREKISEHFLAANHKKVDPDNVDLLGDESSVIVGDNTDYIAMRDFIASNNMANQSNYNTVKSLMDIDNFIDYNIVQIFGQNLDWPGGNIKFWRSPDTDNLWRWIVYDLDQTYNIYEEYGNCQNSLALATTANGQGWPNPEWGTRVLRNLLNNPEFKNRFIQRFAYHLNTTFAPDRQLAILDSIQNLIRTEIPFHLNRWAETNPMTVEDWEYQVDVIRNFINNRSACFTDMVVQHFNLQGSTDFTIINDPDKGKIYLEDNKLPDSYSAPHFAGVPVKIEANPKQNFEFVGWKMKNNTMSSENIIPAGSSWNYLDDGTNPDIAWITSSFDDSGWSSGTGPLGYNETIISTTLDYGDDASNKYTTYYFRKKISITDINSVSDFAWTLLMGDGAIVYVNGVEAFRKNMPDGTADNTTLAITYAADADETTYTSISIDKSFLVEGENIIAVEVHQSSLGSSDVSFDLSLASTTIHYGAPTIVSDIIINYVPSGNDTIETIYKNVSPIVISEIQYNSTNQNNNFIEIYNNGTKDIDLSLFSITGDIQFNFSNGYILQKQDYIVISKSLAGFDSDIPNKFQWTSGDLSSTGGTIAIVYNNSDTVDIVSFSSQSPWPALSTANQSIVIKTLTADNSIGSNWIKSTSASPGGSQKTTTISGIYINEVMAGNTYAYADESGEYDDWVELYNSTDNPIDIGGLFMTDDLLVKDRYLIPTGYSQQTTIPAHGYLVLWADDQISQGPLHMNFNLSKNGETLALIQANYLDTTFIDIFTYYTMSPDWSFGRTTDGSDEFNYLTMDTPGTSNFYDPVIPNELTEMNDAEIYLFPNPVRSILHIKSQEDISDIKIYNSMGKLIYQSENADINVSDFIPDLYLAYVTINANTKVLKFIKY